MVRPSEGREPSRQLDMTPMVHGVLAPLMPATCTRYVVPASVMDVVPTKEGPRRGGKRSCPPRFLVPRNDTFRNDPLCAGRSRTVRRPSARNRRRHPLVRRPRRHRTQAGKNAGCVTDRHVPLWDRAPALIHRCDPGRVADAGAPSTVKHVSVTYWRTSLWRLSRTA